MNSGPPDPETQEEKQAPPEAVAGYGTPGLRAYLEKYHGHFTDEALTAALVKAGYPADAVRDGFSYVADREASAPIRAQARRIVIGLYLVGYVVLVAGMFASGLAQRDQFLGVLPGIIGSAVLTFILGIAFLIAIDWVGRKRIGAANLSGALGVLVALPVVLWVIVTGLCVATTGIPFSWVGSLRQ